ncbi:NYN domain-containing protein [Tessaracoccus sp. Y1736]
MSENLIHIVPATPSVVATPAAPQPPVKKRALRGRRLVLVDIENIARGAVLVEEQAVNARQALLEAVSLHGQEQIIIATSHVGLLATGWGWPGPRLVVRSGDNGADLALLEVIADERIAERFDEVVLVSGDGIFTDAVAGLGAQGVSVTVVAHADGCSRRLRMAAAHTVFFLAEADTAHGAA